MAVERIIGVDFGTSTSVIRVKRYENGNPIGEKLETKEVIFGGNGAMVPTLIMKKDDDPSVCYFGFEAQQKKKKFSNFHSFKMDLESCDPSVRAQARLLTEEFYGYLAKQYKSQSEGGHLGNPGDKERTIISYPVKWSEETKNFMLETAKKAGFPNVAGMDEAQAAIQAVIVMSTDHLQKHGLLKNGVGANILLIDMGAGTTDLVLARYVPGDKPKTEVLNTWPKSGEIQFGGREIDNLLQNFFRGLLDEDDAEMVFRRIGSDKFKSWKEETVSPALRKSDSVSDFEVFDSCIEMMGVDMEDYCLDRTAFENCLADYLKQFPVLIDGCLQNVGMSGSDVDLVIVTGGHSQWYFVDEMLSGRMPQFGALNLPKIQENPARIIPISRPQETVALGLAYSGIHFDLSASTADDVQDRKKVMENHVHTLHAVKEQKHDQTKEAGQKEPVHTHTDSVGQSAPETAEQMRARMIEEVRRRSAAAQIDPKDAPYTPESEFELVSNGGNYVIKKYLGCSSVVSIPPTIRGRKVAEIGFCAFGGPTIVQGNKNIEVVIIPDTVRNIGIRAFTGCFNLHTVIAHKGIENIGECAFWGCNKLQKFDFGMGEREPGHVCFPPGLKKIGPSAFTMYPTLQRTVFKEIHLSRRTKVGGYIGGKKGFDEKHSAVFYYD